MPISFFHLLSSGFPLPPIQRKMNAEVGVSVSVNNWLLPLPSKKSSEGALMPLALLPFAQRLSTAVIAAQVVAL